MFPGLPFGTMDAWGVIAISGLLHSAYWVFFTKALENGDLSLVYPIMRASPAPVLLISVVVLNEPVSLSGSAGILLIATGSPVAKKRSPWLGHSQSDLWFSRLSNVFHQRSAFERASFESRKMVGVK